MGRLSHTARLLEWSMVIILVLITKACLCSSSCSDKEASCARLAARGDCTRNRKYMSRHCPVSCGLCEKSTLSSIVSLAEAQTSYFLWMLCTFVVGFLLVLLKVYFAGGVCRSKKRLDGKVVIVTGANSGIGYYTALDLAWRRARVILACRNFKKGLQVMKKIQTLSRNPDVEVKKLDLASFLSIRNFAADIINEEERLDILVNNAGLLPAWKRHLTEDGYEECFQVNYLGPFLLTNLLVPKMLRAQGDTKGRIVNVSSHYYKQSKGLDFENLQGERKYGAWSAYKNSKLALQLFTYELSKRLAGTRVIANAVHPGVSMTNIHSKVYVPLKKMFLLAMSPLFFLIFKSDRQAAQTSLHCCVSEEVEEVNGGYFVDCAQAEQCCMATDDGVAKKLWEVSERLAEM